MKTLTLTTIIYLLLFSFSKLLDGRGLKQVASGDEAPCTNCESSESLETVSSSTRSSASSSGIQRSETTSSRQSQSSFSSSSSSRSESSSSSEVKVDTSMKPEVAAKSEPSPAPSPIPAPKEVKVETRTLTERVRAAILEANINLLAKLIVENDDVTEIALGFTFPPELRSRYLFETSFRFTDPDVVSLKGMAQAILISGQAGKLTEIFIDAVYGLDFDTNVCHPSPKAEPKKGYYRKMVERTTHTHGKSMHTNSTVVVTYSTPQGTKTMIRKYSSLPYTYNETVTEVKHESDAELDEPIESVPAVELPEPAPARGTAEIPECFTQEEIDTIRNNLLEDFNDEELMKDIRFSDPRKDTPSRRRHLLVVGTPVNSWPCASCWKPRFCNKNAYWCPQ